MQNQKALRETFEFHAEAFDAVYPIHSMIPDYICPYILLVSVTSPDTNVLNVDWKYWKEQGIRSTYYSPALHRAFFTPPADVVQVLGMKVPSEPADPIPKTKKTKSKPKR